MPIVRFSELIDEVRGLGVIRVAVAAAEDEHALGAIKLATASGLRVEALLVGSAQMVRAGAGRLGLDLSPHRLVDAEDAPTAAERATDAVWRGEADILMKGGLTTARLLKPVLAHEREQELPPSAGPGGERGPARRRLLSHVAVFEIPTYHKLLLVTDGGMIIAPTLEEKVQIIENARQVAVALGIATPKVAVLSAVETVNPKMPSTVEAHELAEMARSGRLPGVIVDGPLALDGAVSAVSAAYKGIESPVAGDTDIMLVPDIELGNVLGKALVYFAEARMAGVVVGGVAPIVLTSRSETPEGKLTSLALAALCGHLRSS